MAGEDGAQARSVEQLLQQLQDEPYKFDFFEAMRQLECAFRDAPRFGQSLRLSEEPARLSQEPSLKFAPSTLASFEPRRGQPGHRLSVFFFGMFGPNGALPLHLTEFVRDRMRHHDDYTMAAFVNLFHHRMLSLFYRAWADAQPTVHFDRPESDRFSVYVGSLFGIGMPSLLNRDALPDLAKLSYAGHLAGQTRHADGLRGMLVDFFKLPVSIEEFVGEWTEIPANCRFLMGTQPASARPGVACTLGSHVWECQLKFRIVVGPLSWKDFVRLMPEGESLPRLSALVRNYIGDELLWELNLVLRKDETPGWVLGTQQLGQSMWLDNAGVDGDPDDLVLQPARTSMESML